MRLAFLIATLAGVLFSQAVLAAEPGFCHTVCDSERRACRTDVQQLAAEDGEGLLVMQEKNPLARTAAKTGAPSSEAARVNERSAVQNRRIARTAACEATFRRCERACTPPAAKAPVSPIFTPRKSG